MNLQIEEKHDSYQPIIVKEEIVGTISTKINNIDINCPRCRSKNINKNGKTQIKRQRYICKECSKSFSEMTGSPLSYSKKGIDIWLKYLSCIKENYTLRKAALELKINLTTSFHWRHKILSVLGTKIIDNKLIGIIEIDELRFNENFKGSKIPNINPFIKRESRFYQNLALSNNNNPNAITILSCKDSSDSILFKAVTKGKIKKEHLDKVLAPVISKGEVLVTPRNNQYIIFAKANKLKLNMTGSINFNLEGVDIKRAKEQSKKFRIFLSRFKGVATKYITYYINWYRVCLEKRDAILDLLKMFINGKKQIRVYEFRDVKFDGSILKIS